MADTLVIGLGSAKPPMKGMQKGMSEEMDIKKCTMVQVPMQSLARYGADGSSEAPKVGDEIDFQGKGKLSSIDGENATLELTELNGDPIDGEAQESGEPNQDDESKIMAEMKRLDEEESAKRRA